MTQTIGDASEAAELVQFRLDIREWLGANLPEGWFDVGFTLTADERAAFNESWTRKLYEGGWICATWPKEFGGRGLSTLEGVALAEEFALAAAPMRADFLGDTLVGPTILQWGTDEQKHEFLPKILRGEIRWCQGFSEPDSGSDLASLSCSARLDGDQWVINGQKVWTSRADVADYCFLLARTDPDAPKHQGISYLLVPMNQPGIDASGIRQPDGSEEFAEVFFSDARCPEHNVVGGVNNGWRVANSTLGFERGMSAMTSHNRFEEEFKQIVAAATANGLVEDPVLRQRMMRFYTKVQILRVNGRRTLAATLSGSQDSGVRALAATNKVFWTEMHQDAMELALATFGTSSLLVDAGPPDGKWPGPFHGVPPAGYPVSRMMAAYLFSRGETIFGGTSQIQRNIIGERELGLSKEPPITSS